MPTQAERVTALETHYEHVDKTLTVMSGTLDAIRSEVAELRETVRAEIADVRTMVHEEIAQVRTHLDGKLERIQKDIADDRVERSETKLRVALRVTGWLVGVVTTVLGTVVGALFFFARFLLPRLDKLASLAQDTAPLVG